MVSRHIFSHSLSPSLCPFTVVLSLTAWGGNGWICEQIQMFQVEKRSHVGLGTVGVKAAIGVVRAFCVWEVWQSHDGW